MQALAGKPVYLIRTYFIMTFDDFDFSPALSEGIYYLGFSKPTPIQQQAIPVILSGRDLIACAQTGTGKTAAYVLPLLHKIIDHRHEGLNTLILVPTRELAVQIDQQIEGLSYFTEISSIPIYGGGDGAAWDQQKKALLQGANIVIAPPGRLISHLASGQISLKSIRHVVLDEADRMLDMGFFEDIMRIMSYLPPERQTLLFSATMPPQMRKLAANLLKDPEEINIAVSVPASGINQQAYMAHDPQKLPLLLKILKDGDFGSVIIFASTKEKVKKLEQTLRRSGIEAAAFHSDLEQKEREELLLRFRHRQLPVLVGTDVLSRGIDIEGISLVINYDVPPDPEDYVHRIGRTARGERTGTAITFINDQCRPKFQRIERLIGREIPKTPLPEGMGDGPSYTAVMESRGRTGQKKGGHWKNRKKGSGSHNGRNRGKEGNSGSKA